MKILVLNGNPKREKSYTMHITRAFLDGMKDTSPQDVHIVNIIDTPIPFTLLHYFSNSRMFVNRPKRQQLRKYVSDIMGICIIHRKEVAYLSC